MSIQTRRKQNSREIMYPKKNSFYSLSHYRVRGCKYYYFPLFCSLRLRLPVAWIQYNSYTAYSRHVTSAISLSSPSRQLARHHSLLNKAVKNIMKQLVSPLKRESEYKITIRFFIWIIKLPPLENNAGFGLYAHLGDKFCV